MNKKGNINKKYKNNKVKTKFDIYIILIVIALIQAIIIYTSIKYMSYLEKYKSSSELGRITYQCDEYKANILDNEEYNVHISINEIENGSCYKVLYGIGDNYIEEDIENGEKDIQFSFETEGENNCHISIKKESEVIDESWNKKIYYIKSYESQFLDILSKNGVGVHYRPTNLYEQYEESLELVKTLGVKNVRADLIYQYIRKDDGSYDFNYYDEWIKKAEEKGINVFLILNGLWSYFGSDQIVNTEKELNEFTKFADATISRYQYVKMYEILNEPNLRSYTTDEKIGWYSRVVASVSQKVKAEKYNVNLISGVTACALVDSSKCLATYTFLNKITQNNAYMYSNSYSYHPYDRDNVEIQNENMLRLLKSHKELLNGYGGFIKNYVSEYGVPSYTGNQVTEEIQANKLVQQTVMMDEYSVDFSSIYNFWNTGNDSSNSEQNYGLVHNDYTPKKSYYAMKNYYQNTNGAEYIGKVSMQDGLEFHIYDKDGKPKAIAWSDNTQNNITIDYTGFTAYDIYGKEIENTEGKLTITTSPVYLEGLGQEYFYLAITNVAKGKYQEFLSKYNEELKNQDEIKKLINDQITYLEEIESKAKGAQNSQEKITIETQELAEKAMQANYEIGNKLIEAQVKQTMLVEDVKLSSMLDSLNDIGESFEDLVTVSSNTVNSENITNAESKIKEYEEKSPYYEDLGTVYTDKIKEFARDYYETATYINGLEETNDIKNGLIESKALHSYYLAEWPSKWLNLKSEKYLSENPVTLNYSISSEKITNQDVVVTLNIGGDSTITNNLNSNIYTFTENGEFTFEYTRRGKEYKETAKVDYIDKTPPTITGIENEKIYLDKVTPIISDDNLKTVKLYKDSSLIETYKQNDTISEDGRYSLEAEDEAGNRTNIEFDISRTPATITYSQSELTNKDVIATIESNYDIQVTNNSNSKQYTFIENGEFTFEYTIRGQAFTVNAWVDYIDKTPPIVTGVQNGKTYYSKVAVNIQEDNLESVIFTKNGEQIEFTNGMTLEEYAIYELIAKDKAGNEIDYLFEIAEKVHDTYKMDDTYIKNIDGNTLLTTFKEKLALKEDFEILRGEEILQDTEVIATGDILKTSAGESYTLVVKGDLDSNGSANIVDLLKLRKYVSTGAKVETIETIAADIDLDDKLNIIDILKLRKILAS